MEWFKTALTRPPMGRILIWFDDEAFTANVLANAIVDCPALEMTWDLTSDPSSEWFTDWALLTAPD